MNVKIYVSSVWFDYSREASKYILGLLTPLQDNEREQWLEKLIDVVQKQGLESTTVEKHHIEKAAKVSPSLRQRRVESKTKLRSRSFFPIRHQRLIGLRSVNSCCIIIPIIC